MTTAERHAAETTTAASCGSCPHPLADHDALGVRFCAASTASGLTRGCICGR
ncbi:MAG TPA: RGCVC family protein [Umezawaea sp.]|nr:RGCVC family protein [Umezawaea sp.]